MKTMTIELEEPSSEIWKTLPQSCQQLLTSRALDAILKGEPYPTGTDQLDLAIDLAEAGVTADTISKLTQLDPEVFSQFMPK
ncbi:MAG TPA: hypothetical protein VL728_00430 [Cyclobacteriaceae bacterium]|jgi:hypothetical protein|nr:hypothetical protein [Cyclobacteriaceae bacterium]